MTPFVTVGLLSVMVLAHVTPILGADDEARDDLGRFFAKAQAKQPMVVGFLGGSITDGTGAKDRSKCWRMLTCNWLKTHYPETNWTFMDASIGGTGSGLGVFRLHQEILDRAVPDLVFVEFAVNDGYLSDRDQVVKPMEGIVRQIRTVNPQANIVFIYTIDQGIWENLKRGKKNPATEFQKEVAAHYKLPEIDLQEGIVKFSQSPDFRWDEYWSGSRVHPNEKGYALYFAQIEQFLEVQSRATAETVKELPAPMMTPTYDSARLVPVKTAGAKGWSELPPQSPFQSNRVQGIAQAAEVGAQMETEFEGPLLGLYFELGPETGQLDVAIDDLPPIRLNTFEASFRRPSYRVLKTDLPEGKHRLRLTNVEAPAGARNSAVRLGGLLVLTH